VKQRHGTCTRLPQPSWGCFQTIHTEFHDTFR
jgi:hypothetical protein